MKKKAVSHIFGAKAGAKVPIEPFPTDCKSDCVTSGLNRIIMLNVLMWENEYVLKKR